VLFAINVAAINLAAHVTLFLMAVKPRTPGMASVATYNAVTSALAWALVLFGFSWIAITFN
jgi:hypothetical protein